MFRKVKKNQIIISALAVMIAIAGYINYFGGIGSKEDVSTATNTYYEDALDVANVDTVLEEDSLLEPGTAVLTSVNVTNNGMLSEIKLNREQVRAANKENLINIIDNENLSDTNKQSAVDSLVAMNDIAEKEMAAELLLEAKGFGESVVSIVDGNVDVVINLPELTDTNRAQIEDIVKRKTSVEAKNITITPMLEENSVNQ